MQGLGADARAAGSTLEGSPFSGTPLASAPRGAAAASSSSAAASSSGAKRLGRRERAICVVGACSGVYLRMNVLPSRMGPLTNCMWFCIQVRRAAFQAALRGAERLHAACCVGQSETAVLLFGSEAPRAAAAAVAYVRAAARSTHYKHTWSPQRCSNMF